MKVLIVFLFFISSQCFGQYTIQWQKTYGGTNDEAASSMVLLPNHQLVICGTAESNKGDLRLLQKKILLIYPNCQPAFISFN